MKNKYAEHRWLEYTKYHATDSENRSFNRLIAIFRGAAAWVIKWALFVSSIMWCGAWATWPAGSTDKEPVLWQVGLHVYACANACV